MRLQHVSLVYQSTRTVQSTAERIQNYVQRPIRFSQAMDHLPWPTFNRCVQHYNGNRWVKSFRCSDQYRCMAFAQLDYRESLRDIETCLRAQASKLYHVRIPVASREIRWYRATYMVSYKWYRRPSHQSG